jgi:hypothetical protein
MSSEGEGFSIIPNWLMRDSDLTAHELLVYMALFNRVNPQGLAWPSIARIAKESRTSASTAKRTIRSLEARGLVVKQVRKRADGTNESNVYKVATFTRQARGQGERVTGSDRPDHGSSVVYEEDTLEEDTTEEDIRSALTSGRALSFEFIDFDGKATPRQIVYLSDLHLHFNNAEASAALRARWRKLSSTQANDLIRQYLREMPRYDDYEGPEAGEPSYDALTPKGRAFADAYMVPAATLDGVIA